MLWREQRESAVGRLEGEPAVETGQAGGEPAVETHWGRLEGNQLWGLTGAGWGNHWEIDDAR